MDVLTRRNAAAAAVVLAGVALVVGCKPDLDQRASRITSTRVLAMRSEPAEVEPREMVSFTALVVDADGRADTVPPPSWAYCTARKPLAELGPVSTACYAHDPAAFVGVGVGPRVDAAMPSSACRDFGPEVPTAKPGESYGRPVDPDPTGGYYQPLTLFLGGGDGDVSVDTTRISCGVAGASSDDVIVFRQRYHANQNPRIDGIQIDGVEFPADATAPPRAIARGAHVAFHVVWPTCPAVDACGDGVCGPDESRLDCAADCAMPVGCAGSERYLYFDAEARQLVARHESMRVSWFATAGTFDRDRTGRGSDELETSSDNTWAAPADATTVRGWVVLRDDRGGVAWRSFALDVR
ncbi:MAG: hypothetical protein JWO86_7796 [Myxococcaceae bacterium]|jgi:hypothetical protein|nr:hypothetical protein [Myxococcaceae bacterium]MEA2752718.1 hypothetical protein [Myxococcales bacterium]